MTKREKTLGIAFGLLFVVLVGGLGGTVAFRKIGEMRAQNERLADRAEALESVIESRALWEQRSTWINETVPGYATSGQAATDLIGQIDRISNQMGVTVDSKELMNAATDEELEAEGANGGFYDSAAMKVRVIGNEQAVLSWVHALQQPSKFVGISAASFETEDAGLVCEAEVRLWFAEAGE